MISKAYCKATVSEGKPGQKQNRKEPELSKMFKQVRKQEKRQMTMVDVSDKPEIFREATATGTINLKTETITLIEKGKVSKGDPLYTARIAGIMAAKKTSTLIPLCHPLPLASVEVEAKIVGKTAVQVTSIVKAKAQTGVEMEALTATVVGLLTIWDMVKQYEKDAEGQYPCTVIESIQVTKKVKKGVTK